MHKTRGEVGTCPRHNKRHCKNFSPKPRRNAVKNTLQGKTKGANSKNKISGRVNKNNAFFRYYPLQNKVAFAINLRQVQNAVFCTSRLWLCAKKRFFRYYQLQNKVAFAINLRQLQQVAKRRILHFTLVAVANIFTSVVCVRLVVIFTDAKLCLPNLPKRNSSRQG